MNSAPAQFLARLLPQPIRWLPAVATCDGNSSRICPGGVVCCVTAACPSVGCE
jgi:hypothetical protein